MDKLESDDTVKRFEEAAEVGRQKLVAFYMGLPQSKLVESMRELEDDLLLWICDGMAIPSEAYEICAAANVVKAERGL